MIRRTALHMAPLTAWLMVAVSACQPASAASETIRLPAPVINTPAPSNHHDQTAVLAGGCFWGVEDVFEHVKGVHRVVSGYAGGSASTAHYDEVSYGHTGHAESVRVQFDPTQISYGQLLQVFFSVALNPTELNRQGPDAGRQYRSALFYANPAQKKVATAYIAQLTAAKAFPAPIVTQVAPLKGFYRAEGYHQDYARLHPNNPYIVYNDAPKVAHLQQLFPAIYQP